MQPWPSDLTEIDSMMTLWLSYDIFSNQWRQLKQLKMISLLKIYKPIQEKASTQASNTGYSGQSLLTNASTYKRNQLRNHEMISNNYSMKCMATKTNKKRLNWNHSDSIYTLHIKFTCFRDDESVKLTERLVANLVGINQLSFLPWKYKHKWEVQQSTCYLTGH